MTARPSTRHSIKPRPADRRPIASALLVALFVALAVAGCGGGDEQGGQSGASGGSSRDAVTITGDLGKKPSITIADDATSPGRLVAVDLIDGSGRAAGKGDPITVQYVGVALSTGTEFDSSWGKPTPFSFELGSGQVIPGWDQGLIGMKVGGRRELVIPSDLAYGPQGSPPAIGPDETLVFAVDLVSIDGS